MAIATWAYHGLGALCGEGAPIAAALGGTLGNVTDRELARTWRHVATAIKGLEPAQNHEVARAIRTAQIEALKLLLAEYRERDPSATAFLSRADRFCDSALARCQPGARGPSTRVEGAPHRLIDQALGESEPQSPDLARTITRGLAESALDELGAELKGGVLPVSLPDAFRDMVLPDKGGGSRLVALFGTQLAHQIKTNEPFRAILTYGQLSRIERIGGNVQTLLSDIGDDVRGLTDITLVGHKRIEQGLSRIQGTLTLEKGREPQVSQPTSGPAERLPPVANASSGLEDSRMVSQTTRIVLLATAWGSKFGGINTFNRDFAGGLTTTLGERGQVFCAVPNPAEDDLVDARKLGVTLIPIEGAPDHQKFDPNWVFAVKDTLVAEHGDSGTTWWVGHYVITGHAAVNAAGRFGQNCSLIMHMNYAGYQNIKSGDAVEADRKVKAQRELFSNKTASLFAVGPLLRDACQSLVGRKPTMLIPGFPDVSANPHPPHELVALTFGRLDQPEDRIKQGRLAVDGFAQAVGFNSKHPPPIKSLADGRLLLVGLKAEVEKEATELRLEGVMYFCAG